jgi:hypothetical protein
MLTQTRDRGLDELRRRGGDEHLSAMSGRSDAGGTVDVSTDITLLGQERRSRV